MSVSIKNSVSGGGGGISSDEVTAIASDVLKGKTYVGNDTNDEIGTGTLELTGNATAGDVLSGSTFYNTNAKSKQTGTLALSGNATAADVIKGKTFYNTNAKSKQTGTAIGQIIAYGDAVCYNNQASAANRAFPTWTYPKKYTIFRLPDNALGSPSEFGFIGSSGVKITSFHKDTLNYFIVERKNANPKVCMYKPGSQYSYSCLSIVSTDQPLEFLSSWSDSKVIFDG